jgi:hypothetical protein
MKTETQVADVTSSLDYGYTNIQNTKCIKDAAELMFFPTGSMNWIKNWFYNYKIKNK